MLEKNYVFGIMVCMLRFEDYRIYFFILKNDDNEEVERWINEFI